jgi:hypothetical protein
MASGEQLTAAGWIAAYSQSGHPEVAGRDWRTYTTAVTALGLSIDDHRPEWHDIAREQLATFRQRHAETLVAAE